VISLLIYLELGVLYLYAYKQGLVFRILYQVNIKSLSIIFHPKYMFFLFFSFFYLKHHTFNNNYKLFQYNCINQMVEKITSFCLSSKLTYISQDVRFSMLLKGSPVFEKAREYTSIPD